MQPTLKSIARAVWTTHPLSQGMKTVRSSRHPGFPASGVNMSRRQFRFAVRRAS